MHHASIFGAIVLILSACVDRTSGHEHEKQHSHFCEGAGFNLFCGTGMRLQVDKAWYGRVANDPESCHNKVVGGDNSTDNATAEKNGTATAAVAVAATLVHPPALSADCGSDMMGSKDTWCQNAAAEGGCSITVKNLDQGRKEEVACPAGTVKYLYLEYQCLGGGNGAGLVASGVVGALAMAVLNVFLW